MRSSLFPLSMAFLLCGCSSSRSPGPDTRTAELADKDHQIANLVSSGNAVLQSFANENQNISAAVAKLPGALNQTNVTLGKVNTMAQVL